MHPSFWGVLEQTWAPPLHLTPAPAPLLCCWPCTLTTLQGGGKQTDELLFIQRSVEYHETAQYNVTEWWENNKNYCYFIFSLKRKKMKEGRKKRKTLPGIMLYAAVVMWGIWGGGGTLKLLLFHFPRLWTACLQIKAAKRESQIGIPILLRSHARQQIMPNGPSAMGKKTIIEQKY